MRTSIRKEQKEMDEMKNFIMKNSFSLILVGLILVFSVTFLFKYSIEDSKKYVEVTVEKGDTLWNIAKQYNYNDMETSKFISFLEKENNLNGNSLKVGDVLIVPIDKNKDTQLSMNE